MLRDIAAALTSPTFWRAVLGLSVGIAVAAAFVLVALSVVVVVLPLAIVAGIAFYIYVKRQLRRSARARPRTNIIDAEYTVITGPPPEAQTPPRPTRNEGRDR
jgi:hypothetical protein